MSSAMPDPADLPYEGPHRLATLAAMTAGGDSIMLLADPETLRFVEVSPAAERFYGWTREEFLEMRVTDVNPMDPEQMKRLFAIALADGKERVYEARHLVKSGETRDVEVVSRFIGLAGRPMALATMFDLRERRQMIAELRASKERYERLLDLMPDALFVQTDRRFVYVNPAAVRLFGAEDASQLLGRDVLDFVHVGSRDVVKERIRRLHELKTAAPPHRHKYVRVDRTPVDVEVSAVPIEYEGETGAQVLARDITEQVRAQAVMAWNASIVESSDDAIYSEDVLGIILNWNKAAERIYGYPAEEIVGHSVYDTIIPSDLAEQNRARLARMWGSDRPEHFDAVRRRADGTLVDMAITLSPIHDEEGNTIGISAIGHDISERKQLEEAKDEFLSVVSHELRTPLTTIHGYAQLLADREREFEVEQRVRIGERLLRRADDMLTLVEELLQATRLHAGMPAMQWEAVEPMELLESLAESFPEEDRTRLCLVAESPLRALRCDPKWLQIAIANLVGNALKFSPPGERVTIRVRQDGGETHIEVDDLGEGMDAETLARVFEKFVQADMSSTRLHEGVGLGLYIANRIVEMHRARLSVSSVVGEGSTFTITLPAERAEE